ncbi:hypothetical protein ABW19_dt0203885 [Dactylella cylindrospora]|nr:hypothetical protein ABW19_dt0203885 [Dactylella cylindrospora]
MTYQAFSIAGGSDISQLFDELDTSNIPLLENAHPHMLKLNRLPRPGSNIDPPPRQRRGVLHGTENRASKADLKESLAYYKTVRQRCESNKAVKTQLLQLRREKCSNNQKLFSDQIPGDTVEGPEEEPDQIIVFVDNIVRIIHKLSSGDNYSYDFNWQNMVRELTVNEGFFLLQMDKAYQGGELYHMFMALGPRIAEYRLCRDYRMLTPSRLVAFRKKFFGEYDEMLETINWYQVYHRLRGEARYRDTYIQKLEVIKDLLLHIREGRITPDMVKDVPPPAMPKTPYTDDIVKASKDSCVFQRYFFEEIIALAENIVFGQDPVLHYLENRSLDDLRSIFERDLGNLSLIFHGHEQATVFFAIKKQIESFRRLFYGFERAKRTNQEHRIYKKAAAPERAKRLLEILKMEGNEGAQRRKLRDLLRAPEDEGDIPDYKHSDSDGDDDPDKTIRHDHYRKKKDPSVTVW